MTSTGSSTFLRRSSTFLRRGRRDLLAPCRTRAPYHPKHRSTYTSRCLLCASVLFSGLWTLDHGHDRFQYILNGGDSKFFSLRVPGILFTAHSPQQGCQATRPSRRPWATSIDSMKSVAAFLFGSFILITGVERKTSPYYCVGLFIDYMSSCRKYLSVVC